MSILHTLKRKLRSCRRQQDAVSPSKEDKKFSCHLKFADIPDGAFLPGEFNGFGLVSDLCITGFYVRNTDHTEGGITISPRQVWLLFRLLEIFQTENPEHIPLDRFVSLREQMSSQSDKKNVLGHVEQPR